MFDACVIRGRRIAPARFCAPLAGYTHSAFRRLLAELGGCGAVWTEMLATRQILMEDFDASPWLRRRPGEPLTVFQLMVGVGDPLEGVLERLGERGVEAVDLNLACDALAARARSAGSALFENLSALQTVTRIARQHWPGWLSAKIRLGSRHPDWRPRFVERLRVLEDAGLDAVTLHPRFFEDKFKRRAQHEHVPWVASLTRLPVIANGDLDGPAGVRAQAAHLQPACAVMLGRLAVAQPWIFAAWDGPTVVNLLAIWRKMFQYITEDFPPPVALRRIQMFTKYFAANFAFGHQFRVAVSNAQNLEAVQDQAEAFLSRSPARLAAPSVSGL
jgi:tRNA-dihydrouridine synthase B